MALATEATYRACEIGPSDAEASVMASGGDGSEEGPAGSGQR
jgi:hypothetical protein